MTVSTATLLTKQFYEWEQKGRGWHIADCSADLEPPFVPFFGHFLPESPIIDDGRSLSLFERLFGTPRAGIVPHHEPVAAVKAFHFVDDSPLCLFSIILPKFHTNHAEQMEQLLIMLSYRKSPVSFELIGTAETIAFQIVCREPDAAYIETQVRAFFPECSVLRTDHDYIRQTLESKLCVYTIDFGLEQECMRPLATMQGDREPYTALFGIFERLIHEQCAIVQVLFCGVQNPWAESMLAAVHDNDGKSSFFIDEPDMVRFAREKVSRPLFGATVRALTAAGTMESASVLLQHVATALIHASTGPGNALVPLPTETYTVEERLIDMVLRESRRVGMLINSKELCTLAHIPTGPLRKLHRARSTKALPLSTQGHEYCIGINDHQGVQQDITLSTEQRLRHIHVMGATGTGKSTLLHSLMMQDAQLGNGFMCLDPHGDLIELLLDTIPETRIKDVVVIDPADSEYPIGFNILSTHSELEKELLASDLVALFRRFSTSWGDQMNSVFANAILAFLYNGTTGTLAEVRKFLIEPHFRNTVLATVSDPDIVYYWQHEYPLLKGSSIGSILTRLDAFLRPKVIRHMVCQQQSLDFAALMDNKKIILVKLSQGLVGAENSYLLGAFIVSKLQQIAMARQAQARHSRMPFYCYIDEFHHFITPSMASILSGARKYALGLVLAHQDMQQVHSQDADIASSVLSNVATRICFRIGDTDAKRLQDGFASFSADDLQNLATGEAILRVNTAQEDCSLTVSPFAGNDLSYKETIIAHSRHTYGTRIEPLQAEPMPPPQPPNSPTPPAPPYSETMPASAPAAEQPAQAIKEHRYMQTFIKKLAEDAGYKASLEIKTPNGSGQVDVLLEKDGATIAVEISVTTSAEWELHNIQKCLNAGYSSIVVCSNDAGKRRQIQQLIQQALASEMQQKVHVIGMEDMQSLVQQTMHTQPAETVMKGYRIKVKYGDTAQRTDLLHSIFFVASSKK